MKYITKRDGSIVPFELSKVRDILRQSMCVVNDEMINFILDRFATTNCDTTQHVNSSLIELVATLINIQTPAYESLAKNLLIMDTLKQVYPKGKLTQEIINKNVAVCSSMGYAGVRIVAATYLQKCKKTKKVIQDFVSWRTLRYGYEYLGDAMNLQDGSTLNDALQNLSVIGGTPLSKNDHAQSAIERQLASCFITSIADTTESIFKGAHEIAIQSGLGGGCGFDITQIRERGHGVRGGPNSGGGVIQTCKIIEAVIQLFNQGGTRAGSAAGYLSVWHADIMDFLGSQDVGGNPEQRLYRLQIGVNLHDNFMRAVAEDTDYYLFSPVNTGLYGLWGEKFEAQYDKLVLERKYHSKIRARDILAKIIEARIHKYCFIMFIDTVCNEAQEWIGASNICTEIIGKSNQNKTVVCNLASVNLSRLNTQKQIAVACEAGIKLLHYSLLSSKCPTERGDKFNQEDQMVGLSFMGLADYLDRRGLIAGTPDYLQEIELLCKIRRREIDKYIESTNGQFNPIRSTTSPPNESLSIICATTSSHELPISTNYIKGLNGQSLPITLPRYKGKLAYDLTIEQQIDIISALQKHTEQSISFNTYHTDKKLKNALKYMIDQELQCSDTEQLAFIREEIKDIMDSIRKKLVDEVSLSIKLAHEKKLKTLYYIRRENTSHISSNCDSCAG